MCQAKIHRADGRAYYEEETENLAIAMIVGNLIIRDSARIRQPAGKSKPQLSDGESET